MIKLKKCPFCKSKAILNSPKKLRTSCSALMSDVRCTGCSVSGPSYWPWDKEGRELPRVYQDELAAAVWNQRK